MPLLRNGRRRLNSVRKWETDLKLPGSFLYLVSSVGTVAGTLSGRVIRIESPSTWPGTHPKRLSLLPVVTAAFPRRTALNLTRSLGASLILSALIT